MFAMADQRPAYTFLNMETDEASRVAAGEKRPLESDAASSVYKKSAGPDAVQQQYYIKIMIPQGAAGAIIGKGGDSIESVRKECGARFKMAKNSDFFPGTQERVCLVTGPLNAVREMARFFIERIREKGHELAHKPDAFDYKNTDRAKALKLVVTNTSAGMIIGKNGVYIKEIKERTSAYVQISPKDARLSERVLTAIADDNDDGGQLLAALELILEKVGTDATIGENVSYVDCASSSNGSIFVPQPAFNPYAVDPGFMGDAGGQLAQLLDTMRSSLRAAGYNELALAEILTAAQTLAKYNVLDLASLTSFAIPQTSGPLKFRVANGVGSEEKLEIEVDETLVGAVLGRQARSLMEIQNESRAKVAVSAKGVYAPGTKSRIVSVCGVHAAVEHARRMIEQRVRDEQARRDGRS